jgi:pyruvate/2-oxoglutarate dehydrogenase complex dihydrolipoamide acyltransferase (E2) component
LSTLILLNRLFLSSSSSLALPSVGGQGNNKVPENELMSSTMSLSPAVRFLIDTNSLDTRLIPASGRGGRILKGDILRYLLNRDSLVVERGKQAQPSGVPPQQHAHSVIKQVPAVMGNYYVLIRVD